MSAPKKSTSKKFLRDRRGNVAMLFGLMAIPVFGIIGTAVDYGRAAKTKQELQSLVDGAALAATSEYTKTGDATAATNRLRTFVQEGLNKHNLELLPPQQPGEPTPQLGNQGNKVLLQNGEFDADTASVQPKLTTRVETTILAILDQPYFEVEAQTKAGLAGKKLELAVMLDLSSSMNETTADGTTKFVSMKAAMTDLIDIVYTGNGANTRVGFAPFAGKVNVGDYAADATGQATSRPYTYQCGTNKKPKTCDGTQYRTNCVTEKTGTNKNLDNAPSSGNYPAAVWTTTTGSSAVINCGPNDASRVMPLTNTRSVIEAKVNSLVLNSGTAGPLGTAWAWYLLSDKWASFWGTDGAPESPNPKLLKAAILMTDGEYNTCAGSSCSVSTSNANALALCTNMKAQGIRVFTVGFAIDSPAAEQMLMDCASPGDYHFPYSSTAMREAFQSIGNALMAGTAGPVLAN